MTARTRNHLPAVLLGTCLAGGAAVVHAQGCALTTSRFVADGDGVQDRTTGLVWSRCNLSRRFDPATRTCTGPAYVTDRPDSARRAMEALSRESGGTWRLPTVEELRAVFDERCTRDEQNRSLFGALDGTPLWSSSTDPTGKAWQLDREGNAGRPEYYTVETGAATIIGVRSGSR